MLRNSTIAVCLLLLALALSLIAHATADTVEPGISTADFFVYLPLISRQCGNCYFVDSVGGSDGNPGTSEDKAWRTLAPVRAAKLAPGSVVSFKRGSSWSGKLTLSTSGVAGQPIRFTAYGVGDKPVFSNPGSSDNLTQGIVIYADWVIVEDLAVKDVFDAGIVILSGSDHNIIRDMEITNVGIGVSIYGQNNLVTGSYVHDLHMVRNTPGGSDDYGATGVVLSGSYNEISYNQIINCTAPSYDYGTDGGAFEWFGNAHDNYVHHNWASGNDGLFEVGGGSFFNNRMAYNVSFNNKRLAIIDLYGGDYPSQVDNFRFENNTIGEITDNGLGWKLIFFKGEPTTSTFLMRNNVFYVDGFGLLSNKSGFLHHHNLYYLSGGTMLGFPLATEEWLGDPLFVNLAQRNFRLQSSSPAIDVGLDLGYQLDFDNRPVPVGAAPDLGAFEFHNGP